MFEERAVVPSLRFTGVRKDMVDKIESVKTVRGFTLIEIMIVVAIIGIIATIAVPSYQRYVESTRRTTAQGDLLELAQFMERRYTNGYDYRDADGSAPTLPFTAQPRRGTPVFYNYSFEGKVKKSEFKLKATPVGGQAGDKCGSLIIDQVGNRTNSTTVTDCWK